MQKHRDVSGLAQPDRWDGRHAQRDYQEQWSALGGEHDPAGRPRQPQRDPDYEQWRDAQMRRLDEEYEAFRRERFEREFGSRHGAGVRATSDPQEAEPQSPGAEPLTKTQQQQR